jgi:3-dehydroquinate synthase
MHPLRVDIRAAIGGYPVLIGDGLTDRLGSLLDEHGVGTRRIVVSNPVVWRIHGERIGSALGSPEAILVPDGERHKHLASVSRIYEALVRADADRGSVVVAVGGGVIGDIAGFAAATYLRGIGLVQVPTTVLAQVDASIGGKVGVNLAAGKNLVGAFYPPLLVATDPAVLHTLSRREYRAGLYEVIKYGMACSGELFERLQAASAHLADPDTGALAPLITECCRIKASIVSADERETGPRRVLNFGQAVAWGMLVASQVAVARGLLNGSSHDALKALIMKLGPLPPIADLAAGELVAAMRRDKKIVDGTLHVVLPTGIGAASIAGDVTERELTDALARVGSGPGGTEG